MHRLGKWVLPVLVFGLLAAPAVVTSSVFERLVRDQEHRVLRERGDEGASFLTSVVQPVLAELSLTDRLVESGTPASTAARLAGSNTPVTVADPATLDPVRRELADRSRRTNDVASAMDGKSLVMVLVTARGVFTTQFDLDPKVPVKTDIFRDLDGMVFASPTADPSQLMIVAGRVPLRGHIVTDKVHVGSDTWLVQIGTHSRLVGDLAHRMPWIILVAGLLGAGFFDAWIVVLVRRRRWANRLVDERTAELRAAQETAEVANRAKSEFLSRMSHELRTPMNAVLGFAQLLEMDDLTTDQRDSVTQILRGGRHLLDLINEVLDVARIETGNLALSPEPVEVDEVVREVVELASPLASGAGISLDRQPAPGVFVLADRQRLKQVLLNLVSNAVKYNRPAGSVRIACDTVECDAAEGAAVRISLTDTGVGIAPEDLPRLFTPFERLGAEQRGIEGTGIGLSLSRRLSEAMGGHLEVASTPGVGSTFTVELPVGAAPTLSLEHVPSWETAQTGPRRSVLYIEDNPSNLHLVARVFERAGGVDLMTAMQGRQGIELAEHHCPSLVLLDLHLPDMEGIAVLRELRDDPRTADVPIVVLSADATPGMVTRLLDAGATGYLAKPIDVAELLRVLDEHALAAT